jgi:hypothetical protein
LFVLWNVLRIYSWIFQAVLCVIAILIACASFVTGSRDLDIPWLPLPAGPQIAWLLVLGAVGLVCVLLAVAGRLRILLFLFSIHTAYMLVKGFFLSAGFSFAGPDEFQHALLLTAGSFLAVIGAFPIGARRASSRVR